MTAAPIVRIRIEQRWHTTPEVVTRMMNQHPCGYAIDLHCNVVKSDRVALTSGVGA
jgi:hypothetical protein